jgi:hypothetical protein
MPSKSDYPIRVHFQIVFEDGTFATTYWVACVDKLSGEKFLRDRYFKQNTVETTNGSQIPYARIHHLFPVVEQT